MTSTFPNLNKLLQFIYRGTKQFRFNLQSDPDTVETKEKAYGIVFSESYRQFLKMFDGGMILEYPETYYIDMTDDEPDGPRSSSFYLFSLEEVIDEFRDKKLDNWLMDKGFLGLYPIIPICRTPQGDLLFMVSGRGLHFESPVFSSSPDNGKNAYPQIASDFHEFLGLYLEYSGFPPLDKGNGLAFFDFINYNKIIEIAKTEIPYDQAMEKVNAMLKLDPDDAWSFYERGDLQLNEGLRKLALADFNKAIQLNESQDFFYYCRGDLILKYGSARKALIDLDIAVKLQANDPLYLSKRAEAFIKLASVATGEARNRKLQKALADCNAALEQDGIYKVALMNRYTVYKELGEKEKAAADSALLDDLFRP